MYKRQVINFGSAGAIKKETSGIVECTKFYQRDMDARGIFDLRLGETPFDSIKEIILSDEGFSCGSGHSFVNNKIEMSVDFVDMEAYALAKVCKLENIKFRCFKYVSDNADENAPSDWIENCKTLRFKLIFGNIKYCNFCSFSYIVNYFFENRRVILFSSSYNI